MWPVKLLLKECYLEVLRRTAAMADSFSIILLTGLPCQDMDHYKTKR